MSPPINNQHCPPEIKAHPLPFDECAEPKPDVPSSERYSRISLGVEGSLRLGGSGVDDFYGITALYRPHRLVGLGTQLDWNFGSELNALARLQGSLNLDRFGKYRGTLALLGGLKHVYGQNYPLADSSGDQPVSATLFTAGLETAFDIRVNKYLNFSPYTRILYTPAGSGTRDAIPEEPVDLHATADIHLGLRLSLELSPVGW